MLFNKDEFYDRKLIQFTAELIKELDKAVEIIKVLPEANRQDIQLRHKEAALIIEEEDIDDEVSKVLGEAEGIPHAMEDMKIDAPNPETKESTNPYPTLDLLVNFLSNADISLLVKSKGVRRRKSDTSFIVSDFSDLPDSPDSGPDLPDVELAVINKIKRQQDE